MNRETISEKVKSVRFWWHSIHLGQGITTPGHKSVLQLEQELGQMRLPDLKGKSVLDIGAWDGFYSFECERRGAAKVVALDHYAWSFDTAPMVRYLNECRDKGILPGPYEQVPGMWRPDELPGKRGFDTAHEILQSRVEPVVHDFMTIDLDRLGAFDVVLYLGVLYHMQNPFEALKRVARVTKDLAIIETEAVVVPGFENHALFEFYETNELNSDASNWWVPNQKGVVGMCRAAGFRQAELKTPPPAEPSHPQPSPPTLLSERSTPCTLKREPVHYRAVVHAWK